MGCIKFWLFFVAPPIVLLLVLIAARGRKGKATRKRERERERAQMRWIEDSKAFRVTPAETKVDSLLRAPSFGGKRGLHFDFSNYWLVRLEWL